MASNGLQHVGGLWKKKGDKGNFLSGTINLGLLGKINIAVFENEKNEGDDKKPDFSICRFDDN